MAGILAFSSPYLYFYKVPKTVPWACGSSALP